MSKRIIIPEIFTIASATIPSSVAKKILQQRVKNMPKVTRVDTKVDLNTTHKIQTKQDGNKLAKFNFLCGG